MTALWILVGLVALILIASAVFYGYRIGRFAVMVVLTIFSRVVMERKLVEKIIAWSFDRNEERTIFVLAVLGWGIVVGTVAAIVAAIILPIYFLPRIV